MRYWERLRFESLIETIQYMTTRTSQCLLFVEVIKPAQQQDDVGRRHRVGTGRAQPHAPRHSLFHGCPDHERAPATPSLVQPLLRPPLPPLLSRSERA
jgi:hypothetical protein